MNTGPDRSRQAMTALRYVLALLIFIHGSYRIAVNGPPGFGAWFTSIGLPAGTAIAWVITLGEALGAPLLAWGKFQRILALWFAAELTVGIVLVHAPEGWFVVGAGRNGAEYSVLLVTGLLLTAWVAPPLQTPR